jgi:hypothetical protein
MGTTNTRETVEGARDLISRFADSDEGANWIRVSLAAFALLIYSRPTWPEACYRIAEWLQRGVRTLGALLVWLLFVPGLLLVARVGARLLLELVPKLDQLLFAAPRRFARWRLHLGVGISFGAALLFELAVVLGAGHFMARAFRSAPPVVVGAGVHRRGSRQWNSLGNDGGHGRGGGKRGQLKGVDHPSHRALELPPLRGRTIRDVPPRPPAGRARSAAIHHAHRSAAGFSLPPDNGGFAALPWPSPLPPPW